MPLYEHVLLARQDISSQQVETMIETFQSVIKDGGGTIGKSEYWGLKSLAYKIKKNRKAHFALFNIDAPHEAVAEMEKPAMKEIGCVTYVDSLHKLVTEEWVDYHVALENAGDRAEKLKARLKGIDMK